MTAARPTMRQLQQEVRRLRERIKDYEAEGVLLALLVTKAERLGCWFILRKHAAGKFTADVGKDGQSLDAVPQREKPEEALAAALKMWEAQVARRG